MVRKSLICICLMLFGCGFAFAAGTRFQGKVVDASGASIQEAAVTLTDLTTNEVTTTTTDANGQFVFNAVSAADPQIINVQKSGFESFTQRISPSALHTPFAVSLQVASLAESVVVRGTVNPEATPMPTREDVMLMPETVRVLDRKQLDTGGPLAGGAQMIQSTPGANVVGYGQTGATKYTVILNGIQQGWAGEATSFTAPGSLGVTFDGIPVADPATGLWQSATMPQNLVMQDLQVTYGPGQAMNRWYTDIGGRVEFTPIQPTVEPHMSVAVSDGPYGQQNFAFVGNTGRFRGWSTAVGGGLGRGDDFRVAPDGFGNPSKDGSVFGKTLKTFSAGSLAFGAFYAKAGGYRPTVIPVNDVGLIETNGANFSQATSGFYSALPYADYNKYDTNEMALFYARQRLFLSNSSTLENSAWYTHIRRFHRRNQDALSQGAQVDEWNNPHSNMFGDQIGMSQVLPYNTINFGGYLIHETYNTRNLFYNPLYGGSGAQELVSPGAKFRSGYFQQDNVTFFAQDDFHPIPQIHIIPGVRVDGFSTNYSDQAQRDFTFMTGVQYSTHCALFPSGSDPYHNILGAPTVAPDGSTTKDQGSLCGAHESRSAVEPSIDASVTPYEWLTIYGGYDETYRSPALGGGGGQFQAVDPAYYTLAKGAYSQGGVKVHFTHAPGLRNFIAGVSFFHLSYTNQEIDFETATGLQESGGGNSAYHGTDIFFDADPSSNLHIFMNFAGEAANFSTYIQGGPSPAECTAQGLTCVTYNNLPVSYVPNFTLNTGVYYGIQHNRRVLVEPRFWVETTGTQYIWSNNGIANSGIAGPTNQTMPAFTTGNLSFNVPVNLERQSFNLKVDMLNLANAKYNQWEYISSGGYFAALNPNASNYINAYPGAPRTVYGTITYQF
ncbi:MAG: TonB-dependent receptor [Terracidiphilus sp.]